MLRRREILFETAYGRREKAWDDIVGVVAHDHRAFHQLSPELFEVVRRLYAPDELMGVRRPGDLAHHVRGLCESVLTRLGGQRQLRAHEVERPIGEPYIERRLREEDAVLHVTPSLPVSPRLEKPYLPAVPGASIKPAPFAPAFERLVARRGAAPPPDEMLALHKAFEQRTGLFGPDDPWFESRSRAFWDDTMTRQPSTRALLQREPPGAFEAGDQLWQDALDRSHRGLFESPVRVEHGAFVLVDMLTGAELLIDELDDASRDSLASSESLFDGTVIALRSPARLALLPGAVFHPEGTEDAIALVIGAARGRGLSNDTLLDALLRMELSLRTLSRVKASYAYRVEALLV